MYKRLFSAFMLTIFFLVSVLSIAFAERYTVVEVITLTEIMGIPGDLGANGKITPYNSVLDYLREDNSQYRQADIALAISKDIERSNPLWNFDISNEDAKDVCYLGAADFDTSGMNDLILATCNQRGKFAIALYDYTDHVLAYISDQRFTEDEVITIMERVCCFYWKVPRKALKTEENVLHYLWEEFK